MKIKIILLFSIILCGTELTAFAAPTSILAQLRNLRDILFPPSGEPARSSSSPASASSFNVSSSPAPAEVPLPPLGARFPQSAEQDPSLTTLGRGVLGRKRSGLEIVIERPSNPSGESSASQEQKTPSPRSETIAAVTAALNFPNSPFTVTSPQSPSDNFASPAPGPAPVAQVEEPFATRTETTGRSLDLSANQSEELTSEQVIERLTQELVHSQSQERITQIILSDVSFQESVAFFIIENFPDLENLQICHRQISELEILESYCPEIKEEEQARIITLLALLLEKKPRLTLQIWSIILKHE